MNEAKQFIIPKTLVMEAYRLVKANVGSAGIDKETLESFEQNRTVLREAQEEVSWVDSPYLKKICTLLSQVLFSELTGSWGHRGMWVRSCSEIYNMLVETILFLHEGLSINLCK
ncbi:hypothetical protein [Parachlamydia acanthamoebae]|uniref:hypothetical protein n=1 Tax=Parachlamydia acanthamoebae TaxID=83552 RepID=UPI000750B3D0|nr:hypothetical protein [Parachlamydia acanthamoebae]